MTLILVLFGKKLEMNRFFFSLDTGRNKKWKINAYRKINSTNQVYIGMQLIKNTSPQWFIHNPNSYILVVGFSLMKGVPTTKNILEKKIF